MNPRKILGVDNNATKDEITRAYREKIRKHHPDLGGDTWAFQQVQEAYEALVAPRSPTKEAPTKEAPTKEAPTKEAPTKEAPTNEAPKNEAPTAARRSHGNPYKPPSSEETSPQQPTSSKSAAESEPVTQWWHLFVRQLPLQNETTIFILINVFDIFMTYILFRFGGKESNPIANYFLHIWGFTGMIAFKLGIVTFVCVVAQVVAVKKIQTARFLLIAGTILTGAVVVYSALLFRKHFN